MAYFHAHEPLDFPHEQRDQRAQAEAWFNSPLRIQNKQLVDENMQLKRLLRENGLSWSFSSSPSSGLSPVPSVVFDDDRPTGAKRTRLPSHSKARKTRSSTGSVAQNTRLPTLPVEIQLQILEYAMTSNYPIVDPLAKSDPESLTVVEKSRYNQIAIHFLATCKAYLVEGTRILWSKNTFVFTNPTVLRNFCNLRPEFRHKIKHITLRVIGKYSDDEKRSHMIPDVSRPFRQMKLQKLKVTLRPKEENKTNRGFHGYTWTQLIDFLEALRPPFDPNHNKKLPPPRLLPGLESMRIDFVNFPTHFLSYPNIELHSVAFHHLGCTLNELMITGLPGDDCGRKAEKELTGMVKDDGLLIKGSDSYSQLISQLRPVAWDTSVELTAVRTWKVLAKEFMEHASGASGEREDEDSDDDFDDMLHTYHERHSHFHADMPPAPREQGHPKSEWKNRKTIWKRVPVTRDSAEREWKEFDQIMGEPINEAYDRKVDKNRIASMVCKVCNVIHDPTDMGPFED